MTLLAKTSWRRLTGAVEERLLPHLVAPFESGFDTWSEAPEALEGAELIWPTSYSWPPAWKWLDHLRRGFSRWARVTPGDSLHFEGPVEHLRLRTEGRCIDVAVDYADKSGIHEQARDAVDVYFKMQFRKGGYGDEWIVPGGFVPADRFIYHVAPRLRRRRARQRRYDVYGRFSLEFATGVRRRALELLHGQEEFDFEGSPKTVRYSEYLREAASSAVCIDLPGNGDFCFRLVDYLAAGCFVVGVRPGNRLPIPLEDRKHVVFVDPDLSDLVETCRHYLDHPDERDRIARNGAEYFDRYLHRDRLAAYYLDRLASFPGGG